MPRDGASLWEPERRPLCPGRPCPLVPGPGSTSAPWDPAVTPAGVGTVGPRACRASKRKRGAGGKPRSCKNAVRFFLVLVLLPAWMCTRDWLPLSIPSINPAAQLPRAELGLAGQRLRQSPVSKTGSASPARRLGPAGGSRGELRARQTGGQRPPRSVRGARRAAARRGAGLGCPRPKWAGGGSYPPAAASLAGAGSDEGVEELRSGA